MTEPYDELDKLQKDFVQNVLPYLIPGISDKILTAAGLSGNVFTVNIARDSVSGTQYEPEGKRFAHFTDLRTLQSIINENSIRLYNLPNSNDPNEFNYFAEGFPLDKDEVTKIKSNTYILSFCNANILNGDNILNLWRLYGKEGNGVAIEFEIDFQGNSATFSHYFLGKIIYGEYANPDKNTFLAKITEFERRNNVKVNLEELTRELIRIPACFHKSPYFQIEEEFRLMFFNDDSNALAKMYPEENEFKLDFNSRNELVTYHRFELGQKKDFVPCLTIKKIQIGFKHSKEVFQKIREHLLETLEFRKEKGLWKDEIPSIEPSPLGNIYR